MFFSIVVPAYNAAHFLKEKIEALLEQSYSDFEIIIIDDGSKDETAGICNEYAKKDIRLQCYSIPNSGSGIARNMGIKKAKGEYLLFVDIDDELYPDALERIAQYCEEEKPDLIVFGHKVMNTAGKEIREISYNETSFAGDYMRKEFGQFYERTQPYCTYGVPWNKVYKREIIEEENVMFPNLRRHQDQVFVLSYLTHVKRVLFVEDVLYKYYAPNTFETERKLPEDYFLNIIELDKRCRNIIESWGVLDEKLMRVLDAKLVFLSIKACENLILRSNIVEQIRTYEAYEQIITDVSVKEAIMNAEKIEYKRYQRILILLKKDQKSIVYGLLVIKSAIQRVRGMVNGIRKILGKVN